MRDIHYEKKLKYGERIYILIKEDNDYNNNFIKEINKYNESLD